MPRDAKQGLEARFLLLTTAFEEAIRCSHWAEAQIFLDERAKILPELTQLGGPSAELLAKLSTIDERVNSRAEASQNGIREAQGRIHTHRKALAAYGTPPEPVGLRRAS